MTLWKAICFFFLVGSFNSVLAQEKEEQFKRYTYGEFRLGYGQTQFGQGLRDHYESMQMDLTGGILASISAYRAFNQKIHLGLRFKALAASPSTNNEGDEMFFNYWSANVGLKYFPILDGVLKGLFIQPEFAISTQFTQKYRNIANATYDHQFAIGNGFTLGLGYEVPLKNKWNALTISIEYDWASRNGEITNIGETNFTNSNLGIMLGYKF